MSPVPRGSPTPSASLRVGAIDIGSNALRFLAVEYGSDQAPRAIRQEREPLRLGHDVFTAGTISPVTLAAAVRAIARFRNIIDELQIASYRAVATSAVRDSRNGDDLVRRAHEQAGIRVDVIDGQEEARLVYLAVRSRLLMAAHKWLLVDLGGGSLEISIVDRHAIHVTESYPMGSVRLLEQCADSGQEPRQLRRRIEEATTALARSAILRTGAAGVAATGGNIEAIARLARAPLNEHGVASLAMADLRAVRQRLTNLSYHERVQQLGLRADRADVIVPAALVYERVATLAGFETIMVPNVGVKEGIALDLAAAHGVLPSPSDPT